MENNQLLAQLHACAAVCNICFEACLAEKDVDAMAACIELDRDCSDACLLAASFVARNSPNAEKILQVVAGICDRCAAECGQHETEHCLRCAEVCRHTAEACRQNKVVHL